jgi:hypothetical protein
MIPGAFQPLLLQFFVITSLEKTFFHKNSNAVSLNQALVIILADETFTAGRNIIVFSA